MWIFKRILRIPWIKRITHKVVLRRIRSSSYTLRRLSETELQLSSHLLGGFPIVVVGQLVFHSQRCMLVSLCSFYLCGHANIFPFFSHLIMSSTLHAALMSLFLTLSHSVFPGMVLNVFISAVPRMFFILFVSAFVSIPQVSSDLTQRLWLFFQKNSACELRAGR